MFEVAAKQEAEPKIRVCVFEREKQREKKRREPFEDFGDVIGFEILNSPEFGNHGCVRSLRFLQQKVFFLFWFHFAIAISVSNFRDEVVLGLNSGVEVSGFVVVE